MTLADAAARERIRTALDVNLVVEAAAGTGKTTELVHRMVAVLGRGTDVGRLVAVTFTDKAAGELKLRLRAGLEAARTLAAGERRANLEHALAHLEEARISTIHGFCADLLRERPVEARVDPRFETLTEPESRALFASVFARWLETTLEAPPEGVRRALRRRETEGPTARLLRAADEIRVHRHFQAPFRREPFDRDASINEIFFALESLSALTARALSTRDSLYQDTAELRALLTRVHETEKVSARDYDGLEAELARLGRNRDFGRRRGSSAMYGRDLPRSDVLQALDAAVGALADFQRRAGADLAAKLQVELLAVAALYEKEKSKTGRLDFEDLLLRTRDMLRDSDGARADFQARFECLFVDEFQDTDPLQAEVLLLLAASDPGARDPRAIAPAPGKLFLVGDPKQAIYRFRRADLAIYEQVKAHLLSAGAECLHLTTSFRAVPVLQKLVNAAFAPLMTGDAASLSASYVPLAPARADVDAQPAVIALSIPHPYGRRSLAKASVRASTPLATAAFVEWLIEESGFTVTEGEKPGQRVPIQARHICLLFRNLVFFGEDVARPFTLALEGRGIAHVLVGGRSLHAREEIEAMVAALSAIERPEDTLSVYATLHGPLFAIADETLLQYAHDPIHDRGAKATPQSPRSDVIFHPLKLPIGPAPESIAQVREALAILGDLHKKRNRRPVSATIAALLEATRACAAFALWQAGEQVLANVLYLADLARSHEGAGGLSFRGFLERLRARAERGTSGEASIIEEASDGVRLMTVHKAKGLEFPIVILADTTMPGARERASRYVDAERGLCAMELAGVVPWDLLDHEAEELARDRAEAVRLAYVAATRARDLLVVPTVGDDPRFPEKGWAAPLLEAMVPPDSRRNKSAPAPGCPSFGEDSVLERPDGDGPSARTVAPGLHEFEDGRKIVYWDPRALALAKEPLAGVRREELLEKGTGEIAARDLASYRAFQAERAAMLASGSRPSLIVTTATERSGDERIRAGKVELVAIPRAAGRPRGARFGTLVHALLATVPLDAGPAQIEEIAALQGRILGATSAEVAASREVARGALGHPLFARARAADGRGACRRETPLCDPSTEREILEGVIDLAFEEDGKWTVVDFKTDADIERDLDRYRRQVSIYADSIARATGAATTAILLWM